jgi:phosphoenolpyruvate synthase/pyruvate phosphate dikinase
MTEDKFDEQQIEGYRRMCGEERLEIAFRLSAFVRDVARAGIAYQHPEYSPEEIERELHRRISYGRKDAPSVGNDAL